MKEQQQESHTWGSPGPRGGCTLPLGPAAFSPHSDPGHHVEEMLPGTWDCARPLDKGLNKGSLPFDPALWLSLAKSAVCTQKPSNGWDSSSLFLESQCIFLPCFLWKELPSLQGEEPHAACVLIKQPDIMGAQILREWPSGRVWRKGLFPVLLHLCCFGRLCNDGKMIFPLFIPFSQCHSSCCCSNLFL